MAATAAEAVFEIDHVAAGLTDKKLQNISSKAGHLIAPAKTLSPVHRSLCWNNIAWPCIGEVRFSPKLYQSPAVPRFSGSRGRLLSTAWKQRKMEKARFLCEIQLP
jgi:hypothetical protein